MSYKLMRTGTRNAFDPKSKGNVFHYAFMPDRNEHINKAFNFIFSKSLAERINIAAGIAKLSSSSDQAFPVQEYVQ